MGLLRLQQSARDQFRDCLGSSHGVKFSASAIDMKSGRCRRDFQDHADFPVGFSVRDPPHALELAPAQRQVAFIWREGVVKSVTALMGEYCRHIEPPATLGAKIKVTLSSTHTDVRKISLRAMHRDDKSIGPTALTHHAPKFSFGGC